MVEFHGEDYVIKPPELFRFGRAATLLDPALDPEVRFYDHLLQEYFAGLELLRRFDEGEDLGVLWKYKRTSGEMPPATVGEWDRCRSRRHRLGSDDDPGLRPGARSGPSIEAIRPLNPVLADVVLMRLASSTLQRISHSPLSFYCDHRAVRA